MLNANGKDMDLWAFSFTSFTCVYTAVTVRICVWTRWWTWVNFVFYSFLSICVYIAYIWFAEAVGITLENFTDLHTVHGAPIFWLSVLLIIGVTLVLDAGVEFIRFKHFKNASDWIREFINLKM